MSVEPDGGSGARGLWIAIGVLVVLVLGLFAWRAVSLNRAEDRLAEERARWAEAERRAVAERTRDMLGLTAVTLGLAVREAAIAEDYGRIATYLDRVVREPGVERVLLADADGSIRVATDRSLEGTPLGDVVPEEPGQRATVDRTAEGAFRVVVPITGLNERIGTLVLLYRAPSEGEGEAPQPAADTAGATENRGP